MVFFVKVISKLMMKYIFPLEEISQKVKEMERGGGKKIGPFHDVLYLNNRSYRENKNCGGKNIFSVPKTE